MSSFRELVRVALGGLTARKTRTLLIMLGPVLGAAGIVAAVGLNESAKGNVRETLESLGTTLIVANADGTFTAGVEPMLPEDAVERALNVSTVDRAAGVTEIAGVQVLPSEGAEDFFQTIPVPVLTADLTLLDVLDSDMRFGRFLTGADEKNDLRVAVLGGELAESYQYLQGEERTVLVGGLDYAVVGVIEDVQLVPDLDTAVIIP
ncbi:MAG: ABC transporter permease, partial [Acidimicrobiales bacterium]